MYPKEIRSEGVEKLQLVQNRNHRILWKVGSLLVICIPDCQKNDSGPRSIDHPRSCLKRFRKHMSVPKSLSSLHYFGFSGQIWTFYSNRSHSLLRSEEAFIYWVSSQGVWWCLNALQNKTIRLCVNVIWTAASQFDTGHRRFVAGSLTSLGDWY